MSIEGEYFQSMVSVANEAELMEREEFEDHKWVCPFGQFSSASSGGRGMTTGGDLV